MPDPHDTLAVFAEVSVALAGFSGIVIAIIRRGPGALRPLQQRRLVNLFLASGSVLFFAIVGVSLLNVDALDHGYLWRAGSAATFVAGTCWLAVDLRRVRALEPGDRETINGFVFYSFTVAATLSIILQVINAVALGAAWPFFLGLAFIIAFAFQQFILLVVPALQRPN